MATRRSSRKTSRRAAQGLDWMMIAKWVFLVGLLLAVVIGVVPGLPNEVYLVFIVAGLVTGFLFVKRGEELYFLVLSIALFTFNSLLSGLPGQVGMYVGGALNAVSFYLGLASISVAVRSIVSWYLPE
jgi:hypothetical protein